MAYHNSSCDLLLNEKKLQLNSSLAAIASPDTGKMSSTFGTDNKIGISNELAAQTRMGTNSLLNLDSKITFIEEKQLFNMSRSVAVITNLLAAYMSVK